MRIEECHDVSFTNRVDEESGVIRDVQLLGETSANGYRYSERARRQAAALYEGVEVNWDHPHDGPDDRPTRESVGFVTNPRLTAGKVRGDIQVYKTHPYGPLFLERAKRNPERFGMSHVIDGGFDSDGGSVDEISEAFSVDIVRRPATNKNLFESERPGTMNAKISTLTEGLKEGSAERESLSAALKLLPELGDRVVTIDEQAAPMVRINKALSAALSEMVKSHAGKPDGEPNRQEGVSDKPSKPDGDLAATIKGLREEIQALRDEKNVDSQRSELARRVLTQEGIEPLEDMVAELRVLEDENAMVSRVYSWPAARRNGGGRHYVPSARDGENVQESFDELPASIASTIRE